MPKYAFMLYLMPTAHQTIKYSILESPVILKKITVLASRAQK